MHSSRHLWQTAGALVFPLLTVTQCFSWSVSPTGEDLREQRYSNLAFRLLDTMSGSQRHVRNNRPLILYIGCFVYFHVPLLSFLIPPPVCISAVCHFVNFFMSLFCIGLWPLCVSLYLFMAIMCFCFGYFASLCSTVVLSLFIVKIWFWLCLSFLDISYHFVLLCISVF